MKLFARLFLSLAVLLLYTTSFGQQGIGNSSPTVVPQLVSFSGVALDAQGKPISGIAGITFSIYSEQYNGSPLWMETQNVTADSQGNYSVQLGATKPQGLPLDLFSTGEARWLGVRVNNEEEQPRVLLVSVPYALKAADAQTLGGLPPSAFLLAAQGAAAVSLVGSNANTTSNTSASGLTPALGGSGTADYIPLWTSSSNLGNSILYQTGTGSSAKVGINEKNPLFTLDVNGQELVRGLFEMATMGYATASKAFYSQPLNLESSAFNSTTGAYTLNHFQWQAEPTGNDTASTGATLNLLYGTDPATPAETGLSINSKGIFTFATGQTFPGGSSSGTVTSVGLSAPSSDFTVSGSPVTSSGTLALGWKVAPTNADTVSAIVKRDPNGAFSSGEITATSAGTVTAALTGTNTVSGYGVLGYATGSSGQGVWGESTGTAFANGNGPDGVHGVANSSAGSGVAGINFGGGDGVYGQGSTGVYGTGSPGVYGTVSLFGTGIGVEGVSNFGTGVYGSGATGVYGTGSVAGQFVGQLLVGTATAGSLLGEIYSQGQASGPGGYSYMGAVLMGAPGNVGVYGQGGNETDSTGGVGGVFQGGVNETSEALGDGIDSYSGSYAGGAGGYAGYFSGNVYVTGSISQAADSFKIDHPLDPASKYLSHSSVESPDMMNIYNGNVVLDGNGEALVHLPDWFETLNRDFRYQLTSIGGFAPIYISQKVQNNTFGIAGGKPGMEVSWQITGVRQDAWANAHRVPVEEDKDAQERGFYLHPELFGQPAERSIDWARHPETMKLLKQGRAKNANLPQSAALTH